jgi:hypothetical protein
MFAMRLETLPLVLGAFIALLGALLLWDAMAADNFIANERRQRPRRERDRKGEGLVGLGAIAMAAAFVGRDTWRYDTIAVIAGALLLLLGAWRNRGYLRELFTRPPRAPSIDPTPAAPSVPAAEIPRELVTPRQFSDLPRRIR